MLPQTPGRSVPGAPRFGERCAMSPIQIGRGLGWLHAPQGGGSETAVLICPPLGREGLLAYRPLRLLADRLAAAGYSALRFEYPGCGDTLDPEGPLPVAWLEAVQAAAERLRVLSGATQLVVVGLRSGALLGMAATVAREDVTAFLLFAPVISGRSYARELVAAERLGGVAPQSGMLEAEGLGLPRAVLEGLAAIDLRRAVLRPDQAAVLFDPGRSASVSACIDAWAAAGATAERVQFGGYEALMRDSHENEAPAGDFDCAVAWLRARHPALGAAPCEALDASPFLQGEGWEEHPLRFGPGDSLFGLLCRPTSRLRPDEVVIIGNTGGDPHQGFGDFAVVLARHLATAGVACFRMDYAGLGDSQTHEERRTHCYETNRFPDIRAALDALTRLGYRRFALHGLCSGAFHAFHAALGEPRVERLLLVNQVLFRWRPGDTVATALREELCDTEHYLRALRRGAAWRGLLRGSIDLRGILRSQVARAREGVGRAVSVRLGRATAATFPRNALECLSRRGVGVFVLLAEGDISVAAWREALDLGNECPALPPGIAVRIEPGLDHMLTRARMRHRVAELLVEAMRAEGRPAPLGATDAPRGPRALRMA